MKIGEKVRHSKHSGIYTIVETNVKKRTNPDGKESTRVTYTATSRNGRSITFYGYDIGKRVFKVEGKDATQLSIFDIEGEN